MLIVHSSEREKELSILQSNFCNGNFFISNNDGTILTGCFPRENRNTEGNLLLCSVIIIADSLYFILLHVQIQRRHAPNRKIATYFLCRFSTLEALSPWLRTGCFPGHRNINFARQLKSCNYIQLISLFLCF